MGATYTVIVKNAAGAGTTSGTVTMTETIPAGLTLVSMSGTGWSCPSGGNTCTRSDPLAAALSYAVITVTVNVASSATSPQVNAVSVSGGGSTTANASDPTTIIPPTLQSIAVTPASPSIAKGLTQQYTATGTYSDNSTQNLTSQVTWASATTTVATITASGGLATGAGLGTSNITATLNGVTSPTDVLTVTAPTLQSIAVTPPNPSIARGLAQQFTATGTYSDSSTQNLTASVTWASATTTTATISTGGLAAAVGVGTSTIKATLGAVQGSTVLTVTVAALSACDVNQDGIYSVADAQALINEALGIAPAINDLNGDHVVNVTDVQIVMNAAMGRGCITQ
jgi:hypothetical protein